MVSDSWHLHTIILLANETFCHLFFPIYFFAKKNALDLTARTIIPSHYGLLTLTLRGDKRQTMKNIKDYRDSKWSVFRKEIIERDGAVCQHCGRGQSEEVVLQVHHKRYIRGLKPWEYSYEDCQTICKGCHAGEHGRIIPQSGWEYLGEDDFGDLSGGCEYCGNSLRYVFHIYHPHWGSLAVGAVCCRTLTNSDGASAYTRRQRLKEERADRFIASPRWAKANGIYKIRQKQFAVEIRGGDGGYKIVLNNTIGRQLFPGLTQAKRKVFEVIESGVAEKYFAKHAKR